jgi:hypothetical protein
MPFNGEEMIKLLKTALFVISISIILSCDNKDDIVSTGSQEILNAYQGINFSPLTNDFLAEYDSQDLQGILFIESKYYNYYQNSSLIDERDENSYAVLLNSSKTDLLSLGTNFVINDSEVKEDSKGYYYLLQNDGSTFNPNFGVGMNYIRVDSNQHFSYLTDSFSLAQVIDLSLQSGDTISKSQDLTISWSGGAQGELAQCLIKKEDMDFNQQVGQGAYQKSMGSQLTFDSLHISNALTLNGEYLLELTVYDPHYVELSNGNKLGVFGVYKHEITIHVVD